MPSTNLATLAEQFRILGGLAETPSDISEREYAAFGAYAHDLMVRNALNISASIAVMVLVWWPLDPVIFVSYPEAVRIFAEFRVGIAVWLVGSFAATRALGLLRRHPEGVILVITLCALALSSFTMGRLAGLNTETGQQPWFPFLFIGPFFTIFAMFPLKRRVVLMLAAMGALLGGYFLAVPNDLSSAFLPATFSYFGFVALTALGIGHAVYALTLASFVHRERTVASEARIRVMNDSLESTIAEQTEALRALAQHAEGLREEERGWMANEIHDGLGQELTALRYAISFAQIQAVQGGNAVGALGEVERLLARTNDTMRHIITTLRPRVLDELGIGPALRWLADEAARATGIPCEVQLSPAEPEVSERVSLALFRIGQEALTNVARHSGALAANISLHVDERVVVLEVSDNGVGLPRDRQIGHDSMGMLGIRERALALGGRAQWISGSEPGTRLRVELPVQEPSA